MEIEVGAGPGTLAVSWHPSPRGTRFRDLVARSVVPDVPEKVGPLADESEWERMQAMLGSLPDGFVLAAGGASGQAEQGYFVDPVGLGAEAGPELDEWLAGEPPGPLLVIV